MKTQAAHTELSLCRLFMQMPGRLCTIEYLEEECCLCSFEQRRVLMPSFSHLKVLLTCRYRAAHPPSRPLQRVILRLPLGLLAHGALPETAVRHPHTNGVPEQDPRMPLQASHHALPQLPARQPGSVQRRQHLARPISAAWPHPPLPHAGGQQRRQCSGHAAAAHRAPASQARVSGAHELQGLRVTAAGRRSPAGAQRRAAAGMQSARRHRPLWHLCHLKLGGGHHRRMQPPAGDRIAAPLKDHAHAFLLQLSSGFAWPLASVRSCLFDVTLRL